MQVRNLVLLALLCASTSVVAWTISGRVTDIRGVAIEGATVFVLEDSATSTTTSTNGAFSITEDKTVGVRPASVAGLSARSFTLIDRNGTLLLHVPSAIHAWLEWFDCGGRRIGESGECDLNQGLNSVPAPRFPTHQGVRILRLSSGPVQASWRIILGGTDGCRQPSGTAREMGRTFGKMKAVAAPIVVAKKDGFKSRRYYATNSTKDTLAWILLATTVDDTTYKLLGASYPMGAIPPNKMIDVAKVEASKYAYGGKLAKYILGYQAGSCCGAVQFNNVYAPRDSTYTCTFGVYCGTSDNMGDMCSPPKYPNTFGGGCRPMEFVVNNVTQKDIWHMPCQKTGGWEIVFYQSGQLPLKAGLNSIKMFFHGGQDAPDIDRLIVDDGRTY